MSRNQLIQIGIIAVALIAGYKFIESILATIITIVFQYNSGLDGSLNFLFQYLLFTLIYFLAFFLLIRYREPIADYIDRQGSQGRLESFEKINLQIKEPGLFFVILIILCLVTLIEEIPVLIMYIFKYFKKESGGFTGGSLDDVQFKTAAIRFVFTIIILFSARSLSNWLGKEIFHERPLIETADAEVRPVIPEEVIRDSGNEPK